MCACVMHAEKVRAYVLQCFHMQMSWLLFTVHKLWCMFIYGNIRLWIKALMSHNSLSGSHVGVCS